MKKMKKIIDLRFLDNLKLLPPKVSMIALNVPKGHNQIMKEIAPLSKNLIFADNGVQFLKDLSLPKTSNAYHIGDMDSIQNISAIKQANPGLIKIKMPDQDCNDFEKCIKYFFENIYEKDSKEQLLLVSSLVSVDRMDHVL